MTLEEMLARYGEAEVTRWAQTGRLVEGAPLPKAEDMWCLARARHSWLLGWVTQVWCNTAETHDTALAALEAANG